MRKRENGIVRVVLKWKPRAKKPGGRSRKIWFDMVGVDLKILEVKDWKGQFKMKAGGEVWQWWQ